MKKFDWFIVGFLLVSALLVGFDVETVLGFSLHNHADDPHPEWIHGIYAALYAIMAMVYVGVVFIMDAVQDNER